MATMRPPMNPRVKAALMARMAAAQGANAAPAAPAAPAMAGPAQPMAPQPGGMPAMKKGGRVKKHYDDGGDVDGDGFMAQPKGQTDDMSPADVKEMKDRAAATRAYDKAVKTPSNPKKNYASGGSVKSSASKRADGIATKGFTKGKFC